MTQRWGLRAARARAAFSNLSIASRASVASGLSAVVVVSAAATALALSTSASRDYGGGISGGDDPAPAIAALLHGNLATAARQQPVIGLTSILLRLPFVALAQGLGGGMLLQYRLGVFACALVAGLIGFALARRGLGQWRSTLIAAAFAVLIVLNPATIGNRLDGHPETLLGGALCVAAVVAAVRGRPRLAGVMLGAAIGTKAWAALAVVPAVLACAPHHRRQVLTFGAIVAVPLALALPLMNPSAALRAWSSVGQLSGPYFRSWWWWLSPAHSITIHVSGQAITMTTRQLPLGVSRSLLFSLVPVCALAIGWRGHLAVRAGKTMDPLALLALLLLLSCTLDPGFSSYYVVSFLIALLAWEQLARPGLPLGFLLATAIFWRSETLLAHRQLAAVAYLLGTVALAAYLTRGTFPAIRRRPTPAATERVLPADST